MKALLEDKEGFDIPLTPLIDVVFLLLIFFLVATTFVRREQDHQVELPAAQAGSKAASDRRDLVVNIREGGTLVIMGRVVPESDFSRQVREWQEENPGMRLKLRGDGRVEYAAVMRVMGICRGLGVQRVDLPVSAEREGGGL